MATKYVRVNEAPAELRRDEMVISLPDFKDEIKRAHRAKGQQPFFSINYLRSIFIEIGASFDPDFNAYTDFNASKYKGVAIGDDASSGIFDMVVKERPELIEKALVKDITARASSVKLIYFVAPDFTYSSVFSQNGIDGIQESEINDFLGIKKAKKNNKKETKTNSKTE